MSLRGNLLDFLMQLEAIVSDNGCVHRMQVTYNLASKALFIPLQRNCYTALLVQSGIFRST
jgi:hypothetical protein